jgi:hypothetical protein
MRIISKQKDYFDSSGFIDPTLIYKRDEIKIDLEKEKEFLKKFVFPSSDIKYNRKTERWEEEFGFVYIFFCGKIYCGARMLRPYKSAWVFGKEIKNIYNLKKNAFGNLRFFEFFNLHGIDYHELHLKYDCPILTYLKPRYGSDAGNLIKNGMLSQYGFASVLDPFQARQAIEQFLRNDLAKELDVPVKISDKDRAKAHGYNEWSFRKDTPPNRKVK